MRLKIGAVLDTPGKRQPLDFEVSAERMGQIHGYVFETPICVEGALENHAGAVTMNFQVTARLLVTCDRCLKQTEQTFSYEESHMVARSLASGEDEDLYVMAKEDWIDPEDVAVTDFLLELPTKMLCRADCKGLCPVCGCNLNERECGCLPENSGEAWEENEDDEE